MGWAALSDEPPARRRSFSERSATVKKSLFQGLRLKKQHSTGELEKRATTSSSIRSTGSSASWRSTDSSQSAFTNLSQHTDSNASFVAEVSPPPVGRDPPPGPGSRPASLGTPFLSGRDEFYEAPR